MGVNVQGIHFYDDKKLKLFQIDHRDVLHA